MLKKYIKFIFSTLNINWISVISVNVLAVFSAFTGSVIMAYISRYIIDNVFVKQDLKVLKTIIPIYICVYIFNLIFDLLSTYLLINWKIKIDYKLKNKFYEKMNLIKYLYLEKVDSSDLYYRMFDDGAHVSGYVYTICIILPGSIFLSIIIICVLMTWSVPLTLYTLVLVAIQIVNLAIIRKPIETINRRQKKINQYIVGFILEKLGYISYAKTLGFESWWIKEVYEKFDYAQKITKENLYKGTILNKVTNFLQEFWSVGFLILGAVLSATNICTIGVFLAFQSVANYLMLPLNKIFGSIFLFQETKVSFARYIEYYNLPTENLKANAVFEFKSSVEFKNIRFRYSKEAALVFNDFSALLSCNSIVGIQGESGSGKTTLMKLFARFMDVEEGKILIDGIDINKMSRTSFCNNIAFMLQSSVIFEDTCKNNILMGKDASDSEIEKVIGMCHLTEVMNKMPQGLDSVMGKEGARLSKGEIQRISLARIIVRRPVIMWLDEPTASLDEENENYIINCLIQYQKETRGLIVINTHSKNLLSCVDYILHIQ